MPQGLTRDTSLMILKEMEIEEVSLEVENRTFALISEAPVVNLLKYFLCRSLSNRQLSNTFYSHT
jgi:hypothetical protein